MTARCLHLSETTMPTLTIRNLPEAVYRRLKERADRNRRSLNGEVVTVLEEAVLPPPHDVDALLAEADAWFPEGLPDLAAEGKRYGRKYEDDLRAGADGPPAGASGDDGDAP